jgi:Lar family restriction alleviation protein
MEREAGGQAVNEKLKPCPFCGREKIIIHSIDPDIERLADNFWAVCTSCVSFGPLSNTKKEAIAAWNKRIEQAAAPKGETE